MKKNFKINYLSRDFFSIKKSLINYVTTYYPDAASDVSDGSFASMIIDSIAYTGDVLSYYLDFQTNESFLSTAVDNNNITNLAKSLGYKEKINTSAVGKLSFFMLVPSDGYNSPDYSKMPIIRSGTVFANANDAKRYLLTEDVIIDENLIGSNYTVAKTNNVGNPTFYAIKFTVPVISGQIISKNFPIETFEKFYELQIPDSNTVEIISVSDSDGNAYYEVESLLQNIVYRSVLERDDLSSDIKNTFKPISAQRRFTFEIKNGSPVLTFGGSSYSKFTELAISPIAEPNKFLLDKYNSEFLAADEFEPNKLINGDNYGTGPENTTITVTYRRNTPSNNNAFVGEINKIISFNYEFRKNVIIDETTKSTIINSAQVTNEEPVVGDSTSLSLNEIKDLSGTIFQSQNRAVTAKDYESLIYRMPAKFGSIKRCKVVRDADSLKNNINVYVLSEDRSANLIQANTKIKENLKKWLLDYKIVTDTIDILDAKIINLKIVFTILGDPLINKTNLKNLASDAIRDLYVRKSQIGEPFDKLQIYRALRNVNGVLDITDLQISNLNSIGYSSVIFNVDENTTDDDSIIIIPKNAIYEIKVLSTDIVGNVI